MDQEIIEIKSILVSLKDIFNEKPAFLKPIKEEESEEEKEMKELEKIRKEIPLIDKLLKKSEGKGRKHEDNKQDT